MSEFLKRMKSLPTEKVQEDNTLKSEPFKWEYNSKANKPDEINLNHSVVKLFQDEAIKNLADAPIFSWRIIFGLVAMLKNQQFTTANEQKMNLFYNEFMTDQNRYITITMETKEIDHYQKNERIMDALLYLEKAFNKNITELNYRGVKVTSLMKLVSEPVVMRGKIRFRTSVYWLEKLSVLKGYNSVLYTLPFIVNNSKYIFFALMLDTICGNKDFVAFKISTLQKRYSIPAYSKTSDLERFFLKPMRAELNRKNKVSFNYSIKGDIIYIVPYFTKNIDEKEVAISDATLIKMKEKYSLDYMRRRYNISDQDGEIISTYYKNGQSREIEEIEICYKLFVKKCRSAKKKSTDYQGKEFLNLLQQILIEKYRESPAFLMNQKGYIRVV